MSEETIEQMQQSYKVEIIKYKSELIQIVLELSSFKKIPIFGFWNWLGLEPNFTSGSLHAKSNNKESLNNFIREINRKNNNNRKESEIMNTTLQKVKKQLGVDLIYNKPF